MSIFLEKLMDWKGFFEASYEAVAKRPMMIFVVIAAVFGYLYFDQTNRIFELEREVGGLHAEQVKMNEIITLKVKIAEQGCLQ